MWILLNPMRLSMMGFSKMKPWLIMAIAATTMATTVEAGPSTVESLLKSVVAIQAEVPPDARTASILGTRRQGNGILINDQGLILTIGYLILEAKKVRVLAYDRREIEAEIVGYDAETGFGFIRANTLMDGQPVALGDSDSVKAEDPVLLAAWNPDGEIQTAVVVSRRTFAGYWEYLVENAIYTVPAFQNFAGAALINKNFELIGVGSLLVQNAKEGGREVPGNLFVPANLLKPVLERIADNKRLKPRAARPWMGVNISEQFGRVIITRVTVDGPADRAGLHVGDILLEVEGKKIGSMETFYKELWSRGKAGISVRMRIVQKNEIVKMLVVTGDRSAFYNR